MNATCERCGPSVRAKVVFLTETEEWAFCGHHAEQYRPALESRGFEAYSVAVPDLPDVGTSPIPR